MNTPSSQQHQPCLLQQILDHASTNQLHSSIGSLTLQQLVPVHQALLEAYCSGNYSSIIGSGGGNDGAIVDTVAASTTPPPSDNFHAFCQQLLSEQDWAVCQQVLLQGSSINQEFNGVHVDQQRLLVLQYILYQTIIIFRRLKSNSLSSLSLFRRSLLNVLLPYLLNKDTEATTNIAVPSEHLSMSILDVVSFYWKRTTGEGHEGEENTNQVNNNGNDGWNTITSTLIDSKHPSASQLLVRFMTLVQEDKGNHKTKQLFIEAFYEKIYRSILDAAAETISQEQQHLLDCSHYKNDWQSQYPFLTTLSKQLLLPWTTTMNDSRTKYLEDSIHQIQIQSLWTRLFQWIQQLHLKYHLFDVEQETEGKPIKQLQTTLLVVTTILCPLLPIMISNNDNGSSTSLLQQLLHKEQNEDNNKNKSSSSSSSYHFLWQLIYTCLLQDQYALKKNRKNKKNNNNNTTTDTGISSLLRRRALYLLDIITSSNIYLDQQIRTKSSSSLSSSTITSQILLWKDYILCYETFEIECERHIVDQVWPVVAKLIRHAAATNSKKSDDDDTAIPVVSILSSQYIQLLLTRLLSAEQMIIRKLGILRILQVLGRDITETDIEETQTILHAAVENDTMVAATANDNASLTKTNAHDDSKRNENTSSSKRSKKNRKKKNQYNSQQQPQQAPKEKPQEKDKSLQVLSTTLMMKLLPPDTFIWDILIPSFDSLGNQSVGYTMHLNENNEIYAGSSGKQVIRVDMIPLFQKMIQNYIEYGDADTSLCSGSWDWDRFLSISSTKTVLLVHKAIQEQLRSHTKSDTNIRLSNDDLQLIYSSYTRLFQEQAVVLSQRKQLLAILADILSNSTIPTNVSDSGASKNISWSPLNILSVLSLFTPDYFSLDSVNWTIENESVFMNLANWIRQSKLSVTVGATLASAFITGQITNLSSDLSSATSAQVLQWDPLEGSSAMDRDIGWAIAVLCTLAVVDDRKQNASALLWPAIHKGLSYTAAAIFAKDHHNADTVSRALLLLENGCKLRVLSGLGHGDLVVDPKTQQIMPPPPNIEKMLQNSVDFIQWHIQSLLSMNEVQKETSGSTRSNEARRLSKTYVELISQLKTLHQAYPSSDALSSEMNELLNKSYNDLMIQQENSDTCDDIRTVMLMGLIYAALSSFGCACKNQYIPMCRLILKVKLNGKSINASKVWKQSARSILQYTKWGSCSCILPLLLDNLYDASVETRTQTKELVRELLDDGIESVSMATSVSLRPLFDCIVTTAREWVNTAIKYDLNDDKIDYVKTLTKLVKALLILMNESSVSVQSAYMLNEICALIFQPNLMREEFDRLQEDSSTDIPIRDTFRKLIDSAGTNRPHISRAVLCRITVGWLGGSDVNDHSIQGWNAIPYRDDIVNLLLHKEMRQDEAVSNQSRDILPESGIIEIPVTGETSVSRAFVLCFLAQLPNPNEGLNDVVKTELLYYVIQSLLQEALSETGSNPSALMRGTPAYCNKMRAWQSLCVLNKFVTREIAESVCSQIFKAVADNTHSQIRYFMETFTIQCARSHPEIFGQALVDNISRTDLSLQHVLSLMILAGNFIVGKYQLDYFAKESDQSRLKSVLASAIPWLSSTQGYSQAIAQILVHTLIPRVIDVTSKGDVCSSELQDNDWFLRMTYNFLDGNREMKRLRSKQSKYFDYYSVEEMATPEGILSVPVDEADEANPLHMVDFIKEVLRLTYEEAGGDDTPSWKKIEKCIAEQNDADSAESSDDDETIAEASSTLQRKIIPLDSLNLALLDAREQKLANAAGRHKHPLIVCASLVDKIPNLGGLARTSEIFSAQKLVIPNMSVTKMDNFKALSVGAADWIDIEEVKEENLLPWLLRKKSQEGYWIIGLEQSSTSKPLHEIAMPKDTPTILLLGKEKEGIPVQFLQTVDQCIEIPQFGIIRSLNVHVSAAIAIWEYTRQTKLIKDT